MKIFIIIVALLAMFELHAATNSAGMCTGDFQESDLKNSGNGLQRPPTGTKCTSKCFNQSGRWGSSWCYTLTNNAQWGAECVKCGLEKNSGYYSGIAGGVCNDATHVIRSQKECSDALKVLDITSIPISWTGKSDYLPSGCSLGKRKNAQTSSLIKFIPTFETSTTGLGKGRNDQTPICKGQEKRYAGDYYAGNAGQVCDNENDVIRSQDECTTALKSLGYQTSKFWTGTFEWIPAGCSIEKSRKMKPHFEQSSTGLGKGTNVLIPICKKNK